MAEKQVYGLQILTFLVNQYDYQIVNIRNLNTQDYWLININQKFPMICITNDLYSTANLRVSVFNTVYTRICMTFKNHTKCLIINTNGESQNFELDDVLQIPLLTNEVIDERLVNDFSGIEKVVYHVQNVEEETKNLVNILKTKSKNREKQIKQEAFKNTKLTKIISTLCVLIYCLVHLITQINQNEITSAIIMGAFYKMNVVAAYEYWRLLTAGFVHVSIGHLLINTIAFFNFGLILEKQMSKLHYLLILFISIIVGNLFVLVGDGNVVGVGLSGGLYGLLGVYTVKFFMSGAYKNQAALRSFSMVLITNLFISMLPNISMLAHLGGYISGVVLGVLLSDDLKLKSFKKYVFAPALAVVIACIGWIPKVSRIYPVYSGTDANILYTLEELHLNPYADYLLERYDDHMEKQGEPGYKTLLNQILNQQKENYNEKK